MKNNYDISVFNTINDVLNDAKKKGKFEFSIEDLRELQIPYYTVFYPTLYYNDIIDHTINRNVIGEIPGGVAMLSLCRQYVSIRDKRKKKINNSFIRKLPNKEEKKQTKQILKLKPKTFQFGDWLIANGIDNCSRKIIIFPETLHREWIFMMLSNYLDERTRGNNFADFDYFICAYFAACLNAGIDKLTIDLSNISNYLDNWHEILTESNTF